MQNPYAELVISKPSFALNAQHLCAGIMFVCLATDIAYLQVSGLLLYLLLCSVSVPSATKDGKAVGAEDACMEKAAVSLVNCARGT